MQFRSSSGLLFLPLLIAHAAQVPTFTAGTTLVKVETYVYDRKTNAPIADLKKSDFLVYDGVEPREIAWFGDASGPLDLVFLMDVSGSMREQLPVVADTAARALAHLDSTDRAAVMAFGKRTAITQDMTGDFDSVVRGLRRIFDAPVGSDTDINQAVWSAADFLHQQPNRAVNRGIVIMTDNNQLTNVPDSLVDEQLFEAGAVLDGLLVRTPVPMPRITHPGILHFADRTGGDIIEGTHPGNRLDQLIRRMKARYAISFHPVETTSDAPRRIKIELTPEARQRYLNAVIRARTTYFPHSKYKPKTEIPQNQKVSFHRRDAEGAETTQRTS